jgi:hypothetical protein
LLFSPHRQFTLFSFSSSGGIVMPLTFSLKEIDKIPEIHPFFSDLFSVKMLANPHKIRYIQKAGLIEALYERG